MSLDARLRQKYPDDALRRLVNANRDYCDTHGDYVPELAQLLLIERADRDRLREALRAIAEGGLGDEPWFANYERIREFARVALNEQGEGG